MSAKMRPKKNPKDSLDMQMDRILVEISEIDAEVGKLKERRQQLVEKYEEFKEAKMVKDSAAVSLDEDWAKENFEWSDQVRKTLKSVFKLNDFRPQQLQTINCIMSKKDVLMIAPTGGGKSLCYQLPAILSDGLTIIVSPLISLMEDQVWSMKKIGINAELLCATTDKNNTILKQMCDVKEPCPFKLLYVTPERLAKSKRFMNALQKCYLSKKLHMIAIDEVHCCSQWGHDFRPDYKFLGTLKTIFADVPVLGVTATATAKVLIDVQKMLNLNLPVILRAEFNRPNLYYHVMEKPGDKDQCVELLHNLLTNRYANKSGIIYTFSIADTEDLAAALFSKGSNVRPYHASLTADRRTKTHTKWLSGSIQAVVATVAFGMGIDKPDVRFVIHHTLSKSMENYYQETGRSGRNGLRAECILLYRCADAQKITTMMFTEHTGLKNAYEMIEFAIDGISCRRDLIGKHFLEVWNESSACNQMCDRCYYKDSVHPPKMDIAEHCLSIYNIIDHASSIDVKLTFLKLVDAWFRKGKPNLRVKDIPAPDFERFYAEQMIAFLIIKGYLKEEFHFSAYTTYSYIDKGPKVANANNRIIFYGARVLNLPEINEKQWNNDECVYVSTEIQPLAKKLKKEKPWHSGERQRHEKSVDTSLNGSADEMNLSKSPRKKRKSEKHHKHKLNSSADHKIVVDTSDIIEID